MKRIKNPEIQAHIREQIRAGNYVEIAVPEPRGADQWIPISDQHAKERSREMDLKAITPASPFVVSVLNPTSGLLASIAVEPVQTGLLESGSNNLHETPAHEVARQFTASIDEMRLIDQHVSKSLNSSSVSTYEELLQIAGSEDNLTASLKRIRRFKGAKTEIQTIDSVVSIDPQQLLLRSIPSRESAVVAVRYLGVEASCAGEFAVNLQFFMPLGERALKFSTSPERQFVRLGTTNNLRTLKLLQASQLMDLEVQMRIEKHFDLRTTKWSFVASEVLNEQDVLHQMDLVGRYVEMNF